jgi:hypothetical protein
MQLSILFIGIFLSQFKGGENMTINSYFYDSTELDQRLYSAADFAKAFDIGFETGCLIRETQGGTYGFDIGGTNFTTIYAGQAIIEGRFVEVPVGSTEILTVPAGSYEGQVVIRVDADDVRAASLVVKMDRLPIQSGSIYEMPLYNVTVANNIITAAGDLRYQGGAIPNNHNQPIATVTGLQAILDAKADDSNTVIWEADPNGASMIVGKYAGTGKPIRVFLTTAQPAASNQEHRVWIQIDWN